MPYFLCRLAAPRPSFPFDMSEGEAALMGEHGRFWQQQAQAGLAVAVGPVLDSAGPWGMAIVEVSDETAAGALVANDPVVLAGCGFSYSIHAIPSLILRGGALAH